ncbi:MAG: tRNA lysidine(34) synthetase TilS [Halanaerobium sp. MSAO_Bac5]|nr:MAG: tRNA lysidine(34) synthetase TilS [Halanaerobium sp. MSAO_Bac5]
MNLVREFKKNIEENNLLSTGDKVLLAVSGGADSLTMLDLFFRLKDDFAVDIALIHLDHQFRKESAQEAAFVEQKAEELGIDFYTKKVNLPEIINQENISAEAAARRERFDFFREIYFKYNFDLLALAHHQDDQAETVLLNLFRGSGLRGLSGIEKSLKLKGLKVIHPLLDFSKKEILKYCQDNNLKPRYDSSNKENIYSRNIIRNKILPIIEAEINPAVKDVIARNAKLIADEEQFLNKIAEKKYNNCLISSESDKLVLELKTLNNYDQVMKRRIFRIAYQLLKADLEDLYLEHILEIEKLLNDLTTGRGIDLPASIRVEISYEHLIFFKKNIIESRKITRKKLLELNKKNKFNSIYVLEAFIKARDNIDLNANSSQAVIDIEKVELPLYMCSRKKGDSFIPLGMQGKKKLKDIFIDQKVPKYKRDQIPIIVDSRGNIVWVSGFRIADDYKVTAETEKVLVLKLKNNN